MAIRVNNLAGVFYALGDLAGAKEHYERALEIGESVYGKDHPQVAIYVNNLGMALQDLGDLARAKEHYERALGIFERRLGLITPVREPRGGIFRFSWTPAQHERRSSRRSWRL